jgi:hypothetical protein
MAGEAAPETNLGLPVLDGPFKVIYWNVHVALLLDIFCPSQWVIRALGS